MSETPRPATPPPAKKVPRLLSCLVKGPLGCLAFFLGALVVLVLFLPPALGRLADRSLETWFEQTHLGTLDLGEVWLGSLYGPQRIESLILRDPSGDEVLRASVHAPALGPVLFKESAEYGPVSIHVPNLRLVQEREGGTNLGRALAHRPGASRVVSTYGGTVRFSTEELNLDVPFPIALELTIDRLRFSDSRGGEGALENLTFRGHLERGPQGPLLALESGPEPPDAGSPRLRLEAREQREGRERAWRFALETERVPALLLEAVLGTSGLLERACGSRVERLRLAWKGGSSEERAIEELVLEHGGARLSLAGSLRQRTLACDEAELEFPLDSWWARALLPELVPVVARPGPSEAGARFALRARGLLWPLDGDLARSEARFELAFGRGRWELDPTVIHSLGGSESSVEVEPGELEGSVSQGSVSFDEQRIPCRSGALALDGRYELATRSYRGLSLVLEHGPEGSASAVLDGERAGAEPLPPAPPELPGNR